MSEFDRKGLNIVDKYGMTLATAVTPNNAEALVILLNEGAEFRRRREAKDKTATEQTPTGWFEACARGRIAEPYRPKSTRVDVPLTLDIRERFPFIVSLAWEAIGYCKYGNYGRYSVILEKGHGDGCAMIYRNELCEDVDRNGPAYFFRHRLLWNLPTERAAFREKFDATEFKPKF